MATRDIRPSTTHTVCDVCGRTLLRGERAEAYLHGGARQWVCELCKPRVLHEGWIREGAVPSYGPASASAERPRSILSRIRGWREAAAGARAEPAPRLDGASAPPARAEEPSVAPPREIRRRREGRRELLSRDRDGARGRDGSRDGAREPRHVRAVPTSAEQKMVSAIDLFNSSGHTRTVSGVARSLGLPIVAVNPSAQRPSLVNLVVSWELCWYRYEVDLSDEVPSVRVVGQGYELTELAAEERRGNALADDEGALALAHQ